MKIKFLALLSLLCLLALNSCASRLQINPYTGQARLVPAGGYQQQGAPQGYGGNNNGYGAPRQGQPVKRLTGYKKEVHKTLAGKVQVQIKEDPRKIPMVEAYATRIRQSTGKMPSDKALSDHFGFPCRAQWVSN